MSPMLVLVAVVFFPIASILSTPNAIAAGFTTNFQPTADTTWVDQKGYCPFAGPCTAHEFGNGDPSPFELTVVTVGGQKYFHTLVGDPATGFAIESYTPYGAGPNAVANSIQTGDFSPTSGGNETLTTGATPPLAITAQYLQSYTNMANPFTNVHASGSGSGDPSKVVVRMVLTSADGTMSQEYYKPFLDRKPKITETIQDGSMSAVFVADMRAIGYNDMNSPIQIQNNLYILDPLGDTISRNFEMALAQHPDVTAGRYTYTPGTGWDTQYGWDSPNSQFDIGTYTYYRGIAGFDNEGYDWTQNFDYYQNSLNCVRPALSGNYRNLNSTAAHGGGPSCPGHP